MTPEEVSLLDSTERQERVQHLLRESYDLVYEALDTHLEGKELTGKFILFSGGDDSTTVAHAMRGLATHAIHVNTGIGIESTRQFVRDTTASWDLPLIEEHPRDEYSYLNTILKFGFPGPRQHLMMYRRLKDDGLRKIRKSFVTKPRRQRVLFLTGIRHEESRKRASAQPHFREGSVIWCSPMLHWTKLDMNTYRRMFDVPRNPVTEQLHKSGECLCGSFAAPGDREEIRLWCPEVDQHISSLEERVREAGVREPY
ncbi:MAG: phosphoadenosine phosphosulfate reductase family protein, partial [Chloroflexota bacterium]